MASTGRSANQGAIAFSVHEALLQYMQQAALPFAITRGGNHNVVYYNDAFSRLPGARGARDPGAPITAAFPPADARALKAILDRAFRDGVELVDERITASPVTTGGLQCSVWPVIAEDGRTEALGIQFREVSPHDAERELQRQIAEKMLLGALRERGFAEDAEAARRRAAFLAEAGRVLAESVDRTSTLFALSKLALPTLGAWCIVDVLEESDAIRRLGIFHPDPEKQQLAQRLEATWLPGPDDPFGAPAMLRTPKTTAVTENMEATLAATARTAENLEILRQLGIGSLLTVPLTARKKLLGAITFVGAQPATSFSTEDVQLAEDLAARGALALDNAQMYDLALSLRLTAEKANIAKTAFLGAMSHELRTPLNAIGGYVELIDMGLRGPVTENQRADLARVKSNQQHLTSLLTEILNYVRVGSGGVSLAVTDVKVCDAIAHAVALIEPLIAKRGLVFDGISCDSEYLAHADPEKVSQILVNLLSNSIKFTREGGHIAAACDASAESVRLRISDSGIGITKEESEVIFEPFVQAKQSLTNRESGIGLGLAISRDLARAMNGSLTVESIEGKGSTFTLTLPRSGGAAEAITPAAPSK